MAGRPVSINTMLPVVHTAEVPRLDGAVRSSVFFRTI